MQPKVALITGGGDKPYALGLLKALMDQGVRVDFIGSDDFLSALEGSADGVQFFNLRGSMDPAVPVYKKINRVAQYYLRLMAYLAGSDASIVHVLWAHKVWLLDRVLVIGYIKLRQKKLAFTAHNVNERERDGGDNLWNRLSLRSLYGLADQIFVHTTRMKAQLAAEFSITESKITVIPFGINNTLPKSELEWKQARASLMLPEDAKVLLFFGHIASYKGLEYAVQALKLLLSRDESFRLVIAGPIKNAYDYWHSVARLVNELEVDDYVISRLEYIPDSEVEMFFKAADVTLLPYKFIYQSGVLFLSYSFGVPVVAADVGSLKDDVLDGRTGAICRPEDAVDLAEKVWAVTTGDHFQDREAVRDDIMKFGNSKYSWDEAGAITRVVYDSLVMGRNESNDSSA